MIIDVNQAILEIRAGGVVAMPTETVYGLAGSISNESALRKIFSTKERPFFDPLIVHVSSVEMLSPLVVGWTEAHQMFANRFWPGPLTMILKKTNLVSDLITSGLPDVGVRWPKHSLAKTLIENTGPLAAPSANKFGKTSPTQAAHVESEFDHQVPVIDGGPCEVGIESTVLSLSDRGNRKLVFEIYRPGGVSELEIKEWGIANNFAVEVVRLESKASPGHTPEHYQPKVPLFLVKKNQVVDLQELSAKNIFTQPAHLIHPTHPNQRRSVAESRFSLSDEPVKAARELYTQLRTHAEIGDYIVCEVPSDFDDLKWSAIRDRLTRAARADLRVF